MKVKPKKHLGQHFLLDPSISQKIAKNILSKEKMKLLEIGPGTGALTQFLVQKNVDLITYEIDKESIEYLTTKFPNLKVYNNNILKIDWNQLFNSNFSIVGNFPYNISSQIMFKIYNNRNIINKMVGMFQKEVAERICSKPGSKKYGILSVLIQAFFDVKYLFTVNENAFNPRPKVKSGVIKIERNEIKKLDCNEKVFLKVVKAIFNQRRKMARNSIKSLIGNEKLEHPLLLKRPEELFVENFIEITKFLEPKFK